jgi:hypothetical protein
VFPASGQKYSRISKIFLPWIESTLESSKPFRLPFRQEGFVIIPGGDAKQITANKERKSTID